jgi:5-formyltetrahydrofolate cyclo-ligase
MESSVTQAKRQLRKELQARVRALSVAERASASEQVCARLSQHQTWSRAAFVLFYAPMPDEIDAWPLLAAALREGKRAALPRFSDHDAHYTACEVKDLETEVRVGKFGIREPHDRCAMLPLNKLDLILVPGIGFDRHGHRLGRGKGYYDRLLTHVSGTKCGLAFEQQINIAIPTEPHDIVLDCVVTPTLWLGGTCQGAK